MKLHLPRLPTFLSPNEVAIKQLCKGKIGHVDGCHVFIPHSLQLLWLEGLQKICVDRDMILKQEEFNLVIVGSICFRNFQLEMWKFQGERGAPIGYLEGQLESIEKYTCSF